MRTGGNGLRISTAAVVAVGGVILLLGGAAAGEDDAPAIDEDGADPAAVGQASGAAEGPLSPASDERGRWVAAARKALRDEEFLGRWRRDGGTLDPLLTAFAEQPALRADVIAEGRFDERGRPDGVELVVDTNARVALEPLFARRWRVPPLDDDARFTCRWAIAAGRPTYTFGCELRVGDRVEVFEDRYRWRWAEPAAGEPALASCWDEYGWSEPPAGRFTALQVDGDVSCGLRDDGAVVRWRRCYEGAEEPVARGVAALDAEGGCACGRTEDGARRCWDDDDRPRARLPDDGLRDLTGVAGLSAGLADDGAAWIWQPAAPEDAAVYRERIVALEGSDRAICGLDEGGGLHCFSTIRSSLEVSEGVAVRVLRGGRRGFCALREGGAIDCWGYDEAGRWVDAAGPNRPAAGMFSALGTSSGGGFCAVRQDGELACWGCRLGSDGLPTPGCESVCAPPPGRFVTAAVGTRHACGLTVEGTVRCWGYLARRGDAVGIPLQPPAARADERCWATAVPD